MADISLVEDDPIDGLDEGVFEHEENFSEKKKNVIVINDVEDAHPAVFKRYMHLAPALMFDRNNMLPTALMELFEKAPADVFAEDLPEIMDSVIKMTQDENTVLARLQFLEVIPNLAASASKYSTRVPKLSHLLGDYLLPIIIQNLSHGDNKVRKTAKTSLFSLMEKNLLTRQQIENEICPTILELTESDTFSSYNTGYITLMSQFLLFLGREITERVFLERFFKLCSSTNFCVRKVCVSHIGDFCAVVGKEAYNNVLLPTYIRLCSDEVWGVRKSCAEVIMYVSCACSSAVRHDTLAPVFAKLLQDESRWVRMSAFRILGPFISTFADPAVTTLAYNNLGEVVVINKDGIEYRVTQIETNDTDYFIEDFFALPLERKMNRLREAEENISLTDLFDSKSLDNADDAGGDTVTLFDKQNGDLKYNEVQSLEVNEIDKLERKAGTETLEEYNSYNYWYVSPEMPLDPSLVNGQATSTKETVVTDRIPPVPQAENILCNGIESHLLNFRTPSLDNSFIPEPELIRTPTLDIKDDRESNKLKQLDVREISQNSGSSQLLVPQFLIDHFVSMTNATLAEETDSDMAFYCAYSLPAVALTLGSKNWYLIQKTVEILAANMQYKVRRAVACSLHELATIVGPDIATTSLTLLFDDFIKDLDEVRIGVLKHLAHFLRLINPSKRNIYLPRLEGFLQTDNKANWRFRQELAEQLLLVVPLFRPGDVSKHITFLALELLCDKVAAVREVALILVTELIQHVSSDQTRTSRLLVNLAEKFAHSIQWKLRQLFALLCSQLLTSRALLPEQFACEVMPHLLDLSWDPVPNVRLVVARTIAQHIVTNEYFADAGNQHYDSLQSVLRRLQSDKDRDVRQSAVYEKVTNVE